MISFVVLMGIVWNRIGVINILGVRFKGVRCKGLRDEEMNESKRFILRYGVYSVMKICIRKEILVGVLIVSVILGMAVIMSADAAEKNGERARVAIIGVEDDEGMNYAENQDVRDGCKYTSHEPIYNDSNERFTEARSPRTIYVGNTAYGEHAITQTEEEIDWWSVFRHDLRHSGYSSGSGPHIDYMLWSYAIGEYNWIRTSPAIVDNRVFFGASNNNFYCLNATTGTLVWTQNLGGDIYSSPAIVNSKVFVTAMCPEGNTLYCMDANTGNMFFSANLGGGSSNYGPSSPAVENGRIFIANDDRKVYCLSENTGECLWDYSIGSANIGFPSLSSPAVAYGIVYIGTGDEGKIIALDEITGNLVWNYSVGWGGVYSSPAIDDGNVYIGSDNGIYCLNATTGAYMWRNYYNIWVTSSPAIAYGKVFIAAGDGTLYCLNKTNGEQFWHSTIDGSYLGIVSSPGVADHKVFIGTMYGGIYCLDESSGSTIWYCDLTGGYGYVISSPAIANEKVFIGADNGNFLNSR